MSTQMMNSDDIEETVITLMNLSYHLLAMQQAMVDGSYSRAMELESAKILLDKLKSSLYLQSIHESDGIKKLIEMLAQVSYIEDSPQSYTHSMLWLLLSLLAIKYDRRNLGRNRWMVNHITEAMDELYDECPDSPSVTKEILRAAIIQARPIAQELSDEECK